MPLVSLRNIHLAFDGPPLLDGISLQLEAGERLCLMGRNGTGKTTLMRLIRGELNSDDGEIFRQPGLRIALVSQEIPQGLAGTVFDVVALGTETADAHTEDAEEWRRHQAVTQMLSRLGLDADVPFATLSGGTKRRVMLARALASAPDILLLDEPTNHLDIDSIRWLEDFLLKQVRTLLFVTHDRAFARRISNRVAELDRGNLYAFDCDYDAFVTRREELLAAEITRRALFDKKLAQEEVWMRQGIKARRTRNEGRVRALIALREERRIQRARIGTAKIRIQDAERSGVLVAEAEGASFAFDDRPVIRNLTTTVFRGDRIGIIGPNGSGKTTLLRLLLGELTPQQGHVRLGARLEVLYFDQLRNHLDLNKTVQKNVVEFGDTVTINGRSRHVIGYLRDFLFSSDRIQDRVGILSGGERNRLLLAKLFTKPSNVLVMDEPTNDLDIETLDLLEELLPEYAGTILLVSHDREFLNNVVTSTLVLTGGGDVREYAGGYDDWLRQSAAAVQAATPPAPVITPTAAKPSGQPAKPRKLTFTEARELERLPDRILTLEAEQTALHETMADPGYYRKAKEDVSRSRLRLSAIETELAEAYRRWDELERISGAPKNA
ncbi:MAG: ATP-binding cassette domain-containing protein [Planctomycetota bacterium]